MSASSRPEIATTSSAALAPTDQGQSNSRLRDEAFRPTRLLPIASALLGLAGAAWAGKTGRAGLVRPLSVGAALVTAALALAPVVATAPRPMNRQPSPDAQEYADGARNLVVGDGYVTTFRGGDAQPPRYPPGYSAVLAPFAAAGPHPSAVQLGSKVYGILYVLAAIGAAWTIGGPLAAAVAGALVGSSPFALRFGSLVMSDAFAAGLTLVCLALVHRATTARSALAGAVAGALVTVRLSALIQVPALLAALGNRQRLALLACAAPFVLALGLFQWATFGSPLRTGYDYWLPEIRNFDPAYPLDSELRRDGSGVVADALDGALVTWAAPWPDNDPVRAFRSAAFYPLVLLGAFWIFAPPLTTLPGLVYVWRHRREPAAGFALWLTLGSVLFYLFYFYMGARFMAAPVTALAVFTGVAVARWVEARLGRAAPSDALPAAKPTPVLATSRPAP